MKAIWNYCEFEQFRLELQQKELQIASDNEKKMVLMKNLRKSQYEVTDLKINNHFLFNTLNQMASMAVESGQMDLYESIVNLSKMFHYTLRTQSQIVPLSKELEYVDAYLGLQKLRYQNNLVIHKDIEAATLGFGVPFNFLQPIVENAFTHGFHDIIEKGITLTARMTAKGLTMEVINSGKRLTEAECLVINHGIQANSTHGLSMVNQKIQAATEGKTKLAVSVLSSGETCFTIQYENS